MDCKCYLVLEMILVSNHHIRYSITLASSGIHLRILCTTDSFPVKCVSYVSANVAEYEQRKSCASVACCTYTYLVHSGRKYKDCVVFMLECRRSLYFRLRGYLVYKTVPTTLHLNTRRCFSYIYSIQTIHILWERVVYVGTAYSSIFSSSRLWGDRHIHTFISV